MSCLQSRRPLLCTHPLVLVWLGLCMLVCDGAGATAMPAVHAARVHRKAASRAEAPQGDLLNADDARFLLERTGFQPNETEVHALLGLSRAQAVDRLLGSVTTVAVTPPPAWVDEPAPSRAVRNAYTAEEVRERQRLRIKRYDELRAWWVQEMIVTPSPLSERMTLFWHNHFVSGQDKVRRPQLMYQQNVALRRDALGNFGEMLHVLAKDPAMLIYLDGASSRKGHPNENFARAAIGLFTLGPGNYSEADVQAMARACTGWGLDLDTMSYVWRAQNHDTGEKTVLGQHGDFDGDQVLDVLLARPETAVFISSELWTEFVSPTPVPDELRPIADAFRASHYEIKVLLRGLFLTPSFWASSNRAVLVKSPADLVVGTARQFSLSYESTLPFANAMHVLGQTLFDPPGVQGWPGGASWIDATSLLARRQLVEQWLRASEGPATPLAQGARGAGSPLSARAQAEQARKRAATTRAGVRFDMDGWLAQYELTPQQMPAQSRELQLQKAVLPMAPVDAIEVGDTSEAYLRALLMDPAYQLK